MTITVDDNKRANEQMNEWKGGKFREKEGGKRERMDDAYTSKKKKKEPMTKTNEREKNGNYIISNSAQYKENDQYIQTTIHLS